MENDIHNKNNNPQQVSSSTPYITNGSVKLAEMDENIKFLMQMEVNVSPVILINKFNVKVDKINEFIRAWTASAEIMKKQPGLISAQLHLGIGDSSVFINYAIWESTERFKKAFTNSEFQSSIKKLPAMTIASPHLFKKVAVPGICGDV
ncbi:MAG TPA: antibiotic biosynthesis monooxygenase family protein [Nitrososphaeraceae archaeon]|jgi:quinol monooxygenase YgiN